MKNKNPFTSTIPLLLVIAFLAFMFLSTPAGIKPGELTYQDFKTQVAQKNVKKANVIINSNTLTIQGTYVDKKSEKKTEYQYSITIPNTEQELNEILDMLTYPDLKVEYIDANQRSFIVDLLMSVIPLVIMGVLFFVLFNKIGGANANNKAFDFSKSRARLEQNIRIRFSDVAGCDEEKEEMAELIEYLKSPQKFASMGARIPKGILLVGSPGTGKTLLAKAVAGEANVPFFSISGSDFVEMFVGVGASRVRDMFKTAKKNAPCMIFIDEIDAVGRQRGAGLGGGHDEREQTLNQMLVELDGMSDNSGIIVIAATNRPDVLDPALLRPGRFDRQITVSLPDLKGREAILKVHARNKKLASDVNLEALARRTPGFSGADLENVLNEAAILSVRYNKNEIALQEIDEAIDRVMMGPAKKSRTYDEHTKKLVAYHEAGHAIVGLNLPDGAVVQKVTIIPRGNAGGYNLITPRKEKILNSKKELIQTITSYMGGRTAEELFFDDITTGASGDIQAATRIAKDMVTTYGMSDLGPIQYDNGNDSVFLGRDYAAGSNASSQIAYEIDIEVRKIIDACHAEAKKILTSHKADLIKIAEALIANETLTAEEIEEVLNNKLIVVDGKLVVNDKPVAEVTSSKKSVDKKKVSTKKDEAKKVTKKTPKKTVKK